jgi:hypothetical protein
MDTRKVDDRKGGAQSGYHQAGPKARRVEASITRKQAADACGISQFKLDKLERGVDVGDEIRKAYDAGMAKLIADAKTSTNGKAETTTAKKAPAKKTAAAAKKAAHPQAAQPKAKTEESAA